MAPFRGNRSNVFATCVLATFTSVCRSILPALTPQVYSRFIRSSSEGIPFGIFVKSDSPMRFWPSKSNGAWSVATVCMSPSLRPFQRTGWLLASRSVERPLAAQVDDVSVGAGNLGERHQVVDALGLDDRGAALVVLARAGLAGADKLLLPLGDQGLVLTMCGHDDAELPGELEDPVELRVVDPKRALVREEDLEGTDAAADDLAEPGLRPAVEPGRAHVEREVACGPAGGLGHPVVEPGEGVLAAGGTAHLDQGRGPAREGGLAARLIGVLCKRAHEGQGDVDVRVDEPGAHVLAICAPQPCP